MADIFISYANEDRPRVTPFAKALEDQGWSVFWDRTIPAGKTWRQVIGDALENARSVIVAWSETSVDSRWVQEEADRGLERNILIPILIDNVKPPLGFGAIQAADLISWEPTQTSPEFEKLISDLSAILGPSPIAGKEAEQKSAEEDRRIKQGEAETKRKEEKEQKGREVKAKIKTDKLEPDATASSELRPYGPLKTNKLLKFSSLPVVAVLLVAGIWWHIAKDSAAPVSPQKTITNSIGMKFVLIPPGSFTMGSKFDAMEIKDKYGGEARYYEDEHPQHSVKITRSFYLQSTEVTQAQWVKVMGSNPSEHKNCDDCPVDSVSWYDAQQFINRLNEAGSEGKYRLPTEAEWEYSCRAETKTEFSFGDTTTELGEHAWYVNNSEGKTHPVGQKKSNAWGLYDMHGNVKEWCRDWYAAYDSIKVENPEGPDSGYPHHERVLRGGSWKDSARLIRSAHRRHGDPDRTYNFVGFRVARDF